jgi:CYTH domain-containing protein
VSAVGDVTGPGHEIERTFLVAVPPAGMADLPATAIRQGYVAIDGDVTARIRSSTPGGCVLTVKAGSGAHRIEHEWPITDDDFDALWPRTAGRRIEKQRTRLELGAGGHVAEVDVFAGSLAGLVLVEVEFGSEVACADFRPPDWFGREVTTDPRYTNAALAVAGVVPDDGAGAGR